MKNFLAFSLLLTAILVQLFKTPITWLKVAVVAAVAYGVGHYTGLGWGIAVALVGLILICLQSIIMAKLMYDMMKMFGGNRNDLSPK